eukprot:15300634-Alexandrium_andersonii.AAC.1
MPASRTDTLGTLAPWRPRASTSRLLSFPHQGRGPWKVPAAIGSGCLPCARMESRACPASTGA